MHSGWDKYFEKNKENLDIYQPDEERIWEHICRKRQANKQLWRQIGEKVAVAIAVVLIVGVVLRHEIIMQKQLDSLSAINEELAEKEKAYIQRVNQKWDELKSLPSTRMREDDMLLEEIEILDTIYSKCLNDIKQHGYNERAVLIMLDTYEKRLRVLERLINEKRKEQRDENKSKEIRI